MSDADDKNNKIANMEKIKRMFIDWMNGKSLRKIAEEQGISLTAVASISKKYKWKDLLDEYRRRTLRETLGRKTELRLRIFRAVDRDITNIIKKAEETNQSLTKDQIDYILKVDERLDKEIRLEEGKPTELPGEISRVQIQLPEGVKYFGLSPPSASIEIIEQKAETKDVPSETINIEDVALEIENPSETESNEDDTCLLNSELKKLPS